MSANRSNYGTSRLVSPWAGGFATRSRVPSLSLGAGSFGLPVLVPTWPIGQNLLVLGPPRSGKGASFFMPSLLGLPMQPNPQPSVVVSDPKGELLALSRPRLEAAGYEVRVVAFDRPELSDTWNPLSWLDPSDPNSNEPNYSSAQSLASAMVPSKSEREPFWSSMSRLIISASAVLAYRLGPAQTGRRGNLGDALALAFMAASDATSLAAVAEGIDAWAADQLRIVADATAADARLAGNIGVDISARLHTWTTPAMLGILGGDADWDWSSVLDQPAAVFVLGSASHAAHQAALWGSLVAALHRAQRQSGRTPRPIWLLMDELANVGEIPGLLDALSTLTGAGVSSVLGLQAIRQLNDVYGADKASAIVDTAHCYLAFPGLGHDSAEWVSQRLGQGTVVTHSRQTAANGQPTFSPQMFQRAVLLPDEVTTIHRGRVIIQRSGRRASLIWQRPYFNNPRWRDEAKAGNPVRPEIAQRLDAMRRNPNGAASTLDEIVKGLLSGLFTPPADGPAPAEVDLAQLLRGDQ